MGYRRMRFLIWLLTIYRRFRESAASSAGPLGLDQTAKERVPEAAASVEGRAGFAKMVFIPI